MKMAGSIVSCCVALLLVLTSVSAAQTKLKSITDLKKINFAQSMPKHSLLLLYWFANEVDIDNNNIVSLTFDPNAGDYGSHHYGNFERLLDPLPWGNVYYTIGNLNQETSIPLPAYVVLPPAREYVGSNRDRIIVRVRGQNTRGLDLQRIEQVYITQHYDTSENLGTAYDPHHTYRITTNFLREIRQFSVGQNQQQLLQLRNNFGSNADVSSIRNTWGDLAGLGLLLFIVIHEKYSFKSPNNRPKTTRSPQSNASKSNTNIPRGIRNQDYVAINVHSDEDQNHSWATRNRGSGFDNNSPPWNTRQRCIDISCIATIIILLLGVILFVLYKTKII
ncbi:uncharacterized protein LOC119220066 [Pungitius pungitius]|uniref:uncharacterized protein LOC119220066 n=1 Tax=Pungitius pungitius TaxID=134920 RepID=UPI002E0DBAB9